MLNHRAAGKRGRGEGEEKREGGASGSL